MLILLSGGVKIVRDATAVLTVPARPAAVLTVPPRPRANVAT